MNKKLLTAVMVMGLINFGLLAIPFIHNNWDSEMHLFFASHYAQNWFQPWEPKWYSGFYVYASAPLAHQIIALLSKLVELETGYLILQCVTLIFLPVAVWLLVKEIIDDKSAEYAALLVTGVGGVYVVSYTFGQLPTLLAMDLGLLACALYARFLKSGSALAFWGWIFTIGAAIATHHYTIIIVIPIIVISITVKIWLSKRIPWVECALRSFVCGVGFAGMCAIAIAPFWWWYLTQSMPQKEIFIISVHLKIFGSLRMGVI